VQLGNHSGFLLGQPRRNWVKDLPHSAPRPTRRPPGYRQGLRSMLTIRICLSSNTLELNHARVCQLFNPSEYCLADRLEHFGLSRLHPARAALSVPAVCNGCPSFLKTQKYNASSAANQGRRYPAPVSSNGANAWVPDHRGQNPCVSAPLILVIIFPVGQMQQFVILCCRRLEIKLADRSSTR